MNEKLGETPLKTIENCQPGDVFELADSLDLQYFEDEIAERFVTDEASADVHYNTWSLRKNLLKMIRPGDYFGPIKDVKLTVIPEAYDRMYDVNARGKKYSKEASVPRIRTKFAEKTKEMTVGFTLTANTKKGLLSTEVYYAPLAENTTSGTRATSNTGGIVNRYLSLPEITPFNKTESIKSSADKTAIGTIAVSRCTSI